MELKTPRYTANEKRLLLKLITIQKDIIEKKKTDALTNRTKDFAWKLITAQYNKIFKYKRTAKQLRQLYKNMKYSANVNSHTTTNFMEMLDILKMQIFKDPNIKTGDNLMFKNTQSDVMTSPTDDYFINLIKTESENDDDNNDREILNTDEEIDFHQNIVEMNTQKPDNLMSNNNNNNIRDEQEDTNNTTINDINLINNINVQQHNTLMSYEIEERKKKIELLDTQINYWKLLTNKIETYQKICCCKLDTIHNHNNNHN